MRARPAALLLAACAAGGCGSLADRIVAPSADTVMDQLVSPANEQVLGITQSEWRTPDGVTLAYRTVPAGRRGVRYEFARSTGGGGHFSFKWKGDAALAPLPARGTVVYLSGWGESGASLLPWAMELAERGYGGIAVDLRGTGRSSPAPMGFGPREARDVAALLAHLQDSGELAKPTYLFGVSYGAATSLFAEAPLRGRIAGIVAMEPYANAAEAIRTMVPGVLASSTKSGARRMLAPWLRHRYDSAAVERAIADLDGRLALDLAGIDLHAALAGSRTCTLLLHGGRDTWIPPSASRGLAAATPQARYVELPDENHLTLPLRLDWLASPIAGWLQHAGDGRCEQLALPPDPAG